MSEAEDQPTQWAPKNNSKLLLVGLLGMAAAVSGKSVKEVLDEITEKTDEDQEANS